MTKKNDLDVSDLHVEGTVESLPGEIAGWELNQIKKVDPAGLLTLVMTDGEEVIRFTKEGFVFVKGQKLSDDNLVVQAFQEWLEDQKKNGYL